MDRLDLLRLKFFNQSVVFKGAFLLRSDELVAVRRGPNLVQATSTLLTLCVQSYFSSDGGRHLSDAHVVVLDLLLGALLAVFGGAEG